MVPAISCQFPDGGVELLWSRQFSSQGKKSSPTSFCVARNQTSTDASMERVKTRQSYVNTMERVYEGSTDHWISILPAESAHLNTHLWFLWGTGL